MQSEEEGVEERGALLLQSRKKRKISGLSLSFIFPSFKVAAVSTIVIRTRKRERERKYQKVRREEKLGFLAPNYLCGGRCKKNRENKEKVAASIAHVGLRIWRNISQRAKIKSLGVWTPCQNCCQHHDIESSCGIQMHRF